MSTRNGIYGIVAASLAGVLLAGCADIARKEHPEYVAIEPIEYPDPTLSTAPITGSLFTNDRSMSLFSDVRAMEIGDIVSVVLVESTSAAKSADTELDKGSEVNVTDPTVFGAPVTINGRYNLGSVFDSSKSFQGEASSNQSNSLSGSIAVQVSRVLPNGNLMIQGEKWIKLNQGDEYIRLKGVIRPEDVSPTNTIPSTLVAEARISYGGTGPLNQSNTPGWLTRFFMSPLMPF
ncbi:MAG: flagellar basal body L-ring protein FlgH [Halieaceae bacterium]|jgi:flagellar L-ring protein precursor FlgH|nr:flagellar basal body L-ring protein FlgH [Halieaceae bacterium]